MFKDEQISPYSGRKTRSSSHSSTPLPKKLYPSAQTKTLEIVHNLYSPENPINFETLISSLPGRKHQILEILQLVGSLNSPMFPLLIYGGSSTGKTISILQIFRHLNRPFVYVSCRTCYSPGILFDCVLKQLNPQWRNSGTKRCERPSEFVDSLRNSLILLVKDLREMVYLIFDNFELLRLWDKSSKIVPLLLRIHDILKISEIGVIYISSSSPDSYYLSTGSIEPISVYFPGYTLEDLHSIFMMNQPNPKLYSSFLSVVLKPFFRVTRRIDELSVAFQPLFQKYCEVLTDQSIVPDEAMKRRLFDKIQPYLSVSLKDVLMISSWSSDKLMQKGDLNGKGMRKSLRKDASNELDLHISMSAKYLLLSAYIASRNPATLDASLFDSSGVSSNSKQKKKVQMSMDRKDSLAEEILLKGPGSFPLERLLAIFQCITSVIEDNVEEEQYENGVAIESKSDVLTSDVLLQLSSLCNANFICKSGSCPLEGSTRYRCTIDEEMAVKVARSINFPLSSYLYRR